MRGRKRLLTRFRSTARLKFFFVMVNDEKIRGDGLLGLGLNFFGQVLKTIDTEKK